MVARKSKLEKSKNCEALIEKYAERRKELKILIKSSQDFDAIMDAQAKLAKLPLNSNPVRHTTRCQQCGRPHAVYRKFGLCRICLRQELMTGNVTGGRKSSW
ncbi:30S ribosomal protein S14 [Legionella erythra]|uniref:30S ribosomal protein S14 n=1 Tax=Legionella erythra TaxID=448 RepID=UPI003B513FCD